MKLNKETQEKVHVLLTKLSEQIVNEDLIWVRPWTKEEFDERNYKEKIEKIQKK